MLVGTGRVFKKLLISIAITKYVVRCPTPSHNLMVKSVLHIKTPRFYGGVQALKICI